MPSDPSAAQEQIQTRCCIAGGGPAGMMLGFLLARAGVDVLVLEKHADFLRDFRGDTIHPSTLQVVHELGLVEDFLKLPHEEAQQLTGVVNNVEIVTVDFSRIPGRFPFIAFMPQWDFLNFLADRGRRYPTFHLKMETAVTDLIEENGRITGVLCSTSAGPLQVRAELVVGADGRHSTVRERAGLEVADLGAPMDVLWMRLSRRPEDPRRPLGRIARGKIFIMLYRGEYWQCGYVIPKGGIEDIRRRGLPALRQEIVEIAPYLHDRVDELKNWNDISLLTVLVDRLRKWCRPGLLCIGDAAHAMSPIGGVGINLAIQDAVAAANLLAEPFVKGQVNQADLRRVQRRRLFPTRVTQRLQIFIQNRVISRVLASQTTVSVSWWLRLLGRWLFRTSIPARLVGIGIRPEHVKTPDAFAGNGRVPVSR